jgi:glycosyltransferase involved in cell wall biosynthesis
MLSVVIITKNEEANIARTLASVVDLADEIVIVDSGSTDRTLEISRSFGPKAKTFVEEWKGFARQKNSAIEKASGDWILSLDADEEVSAELAREISASIALDVPPQSGVTLSTTGYSIPRKNFFLGRWIRRGGFYPDRKLRLVRPKYARFEDRAVHEDIKIAGTPGELHSPLLHHAYPTLSGYIEHMNRYSSLGAQMAVESGKGGFSFLDIVVRPWATFVYNYFLRLGFLDGREGLLLHLYHAAYVSWKYAKIWELSREKNRT